MNKNFTQTLLIAAAMIGFSMSASAQVEDFVATNATVITPISIVGDVDLEFGSIAGTAAGGTVVVSTANVRSGTADLIASNLGAIPAAAQFTVTGQDTYTYGITLPSAFDIVHSTDALKTMGVGSFVSDPNLTGTLAGGTETVKVGATLTVGANQTEGTYTHADGLKIIVQYN